MGELGDAARLALELLWRRDPELFEIIAVSFRVSLTALGAAVLPALLCAFALAYGRFWGRRLFIALFHTLLATPAVVIGLLVYLLLARQGPFGGWQLLFTQPAMMIAQFLLCFPILVAVSLAAFQAAERTVWETARTLGLGRLQSFIVLLGEVKYGLISALLAGFGRIIAEVGAAMMVGGNIQHYTRNITTAIALETSMGQFAQAIALGLVLMLLAFALNLLLHYCQGRGRLTT